jgi:diguanylate cyclase (GGDEF)-like protein
LPLDGRTRDQLDESFWLSHMRLGFGVFAGEALAILVYLRASPHGSDRAVLTAIAVVGACVGLLSLFALPSIARRSWRVGFSLVWSLAAGWALAACAHLDGGIDSPLLFLILFPVIYAALAYRPSATASCGASALAQLAVISVTDPDITTPRADLFMIAAVIVGMSVLAVAASIYRAELQRSEALLLDEIAAQADTDGLTGCLNHRAFHEHLAVEIARAVRYRRPLSLIVVDIDDFKTVNDTYGHAAGDDALVAVADALRGQLRTGDVVGRVGGDEFGIILSDTPITGAEIHARRITRTLERRAPVERRRPRAVPRQGDRTARDRVDTAERGAGPTRGLSAATRASCPPRPRDPRRHRHRHRRHRHCCRRECCRRGCWLPAASRSPRSR